MFPVVFFAGAAVLALWLDTRFPGLAPASFQRRFAAAILAMIALRLAPVDVSSRAAFLVSTFAALLPVLTFSCLTSLWLLRALREAAQTHRL